MTARLDFPASVEEAGFPRVAALLRQGEVRLAWAELRRFKPASIGEAHALDRARRAMPEPPDEPSDDEPPPASEAPGDVPLLRHGGRGPRAERARPGALEEDDDE